MPLVMLLPVLSALVTSALVLRRTSELRKEVLVSEAWAAPTGLHQLGPPVAVGCDQLYGEGLEVAAGAGVTRGVGVAVGAAPPD